MTAKRREDGQFQVKADMGAWSTRTVLIVLVASMHPVGREILRNFGFNIPKDGEIVLEQLAIDAKDVKSRLMSLEDKVNKIDNRFSVFEADFNNYKKSRP